MEKIYKEIPIELIDLNPDNESIFGYEDVAYLAETIKENGFGGAIEVYHKDDGRYEISSGHRRYLAAKSLGYKRIPCIITDDTDSETKAKTLILRNIHTREMSPLKIAKCLDYYDKNVLLKDSNFKGKRRDELARVFQISSASVFRYMGLLRLIPEFAELSDHVGYSYTNLVPLCVLSEEDQRDVYKMLCNLVGQDEIGNVSAAIIKQTIMRFETGKKRIEKQSIDKENQGIDIKEYKEEPEIQTPMQPADSGEQIEKNIDISDSGIVKSPYSDDFYVHSNKDDMDFILPAKQESNIDEKFMTLVSEIRELLYSGLKFSSEEKNEEAIQEVRNLLNDIKKIQ